LGVPTKPPPDQSPIVIASQWATRIMTLAIEMVVPGLAGIWLDGRLGTKALFTLLGFAMGGTFAMWQLLRITRTPQRPRSDSNDDREQRGP
jgi:hypothetical protein